MKYFFLPIFLLLFQQSYAQDTISTVAGTGTWGYSGDGGLATLAELGIPRRGVFDSANNYYYAEIGTSNTIRKVSSSGIITTVAGTVNQGFSGDGGPATSAKLYFPSDVAIDRHGDLYIVDGHNNRIRKVDHLTGIITTYIGDGQNADLGDGGPASQASITLPSAIEIDSKGNMYIGTTYRIRKVDTAGIITTFCGNGTTGYSGDGGPATAALMDGAGGISSDTVGNVYFCDEYHIRKIDTGGIINTISGNGAMVYTGDSLPALQTGMVPTDLYVSKEGRIYFTDITNNCLRVLDLDGNVYRIAGYTTIQGYNGDGGPAGEAEIDDPNAITIDTCGNLWMSDGINRVVRKIQYNICLPPVITGLKNVGETHFLIYPNPVIDELTITAKMTFRAISINNTLGQKVLHQICNSSKAVLNIEHLQRGIYFLNVEEMNGDRRTEKIIKQ
jgi:sugar lactone lactonase YvrE